MRGGGFVQIFKDFSNWSTVAVVPHVANANNKISRIFWIAIFLFVLGMFAYELYILIAKFFSYPATVNTEILFEKQIFPVVTVCNMNPYKYSVVKSNSAFSSVNTLMTTYSDATVGTFSTDKWGLYADNDETYDLDSRAADALVLEANLISDTAKVPALYTYADLIQDCSFAGIPCSESDFTKFIDPVYGACYSFNEDASLNYSVSREGIQFGLKLMLTVTQTKTNGNTDSLPTTKLAGARIGVNSRGSSPGLDSNGIDAGVGYESAVSVSLTQNVRAKKPYGTCVDREPDSSDYYKDFIYTLETCFNGCKQRDTIAKCQCANPRLALGSTDTACQPIKADLDCLQTLKGNQTSSTPNIDLLVECNCNPPCDESTYTPTVSLAQFPSTSYYVATSSTAGVGSCSSTNSKFSSKSDCQKWYNNNGMIIQVFLETLSYELYTETAGYTVSNVINDLGGQAGLWLGLSVISVVEMTGLMLVMGAFCVTGGAIKMAPDDDEIENDHRIKDVEDVKKEIDHLEKKHGEMESGSDGEVDDIENKGDEEKKKK
ncbi:Degenerin-like protein asic-2 [Caenorhabditis elegans]|uniref:Degenerin-like protein asic-2 n=1 Tax=Caenorhabditis elegans TaxID=6239 RepID=ASIC2_CAEEL|nr:Degenerin-like protein asic-2 [Caenorhabditis elegans]Q22851.1 RecName: Full=Degenerin-like protein asic-2; AltName: Full=Acid-sensing/amiloride-sensitive ion channel protein 2 [Caenorhabditis elegans]CAA96693.1 Degenerin-like protein asic-2 [Caenorhabditis elegans]|eukprot:NP_492099.1 Degenerin-like protein asic-2 [Caenorhabditis elegans]